MPIGPGKYDAVCTQVREQTKAQAVALMVLQGEHGSGFSNQCPLELMGNMAGLCDVVARQIRKEFPRSFDRAAAINSLGAALGYLLEPNERAQVRPDGPVIIFVDTDEGEISPDLKPHAPTA